MDTLKIVCPHCKAVNNVVNEVEKKRCSAAAAANP